MTRVGKNSPINRKRPPGTGLARTVGAVFVTLVLQSCTSKDSPEVLESIQQTIEVRVSAIGIEGKQSTIVFQARDFRSAGYSRYDSHDGLDRIRRIEKYGGWVRSAGDSAQILASGNGRDLREFIADRGGLIPLDAIEPLSASGELNADPNRPAGEAMENRALLPYLASEPFVLGGRTFAVAGRDDRCINECSGRYKWVPVYSGGLTKHIGSQVQRLERCAVVLRYMMCEPQIDTYAYIIEERGVGLNSLFVVFDIYAIPSLDDQARCRAGEIGTAVELDRSSVDQNAEQCLEDIAELGER